LLDDAADAAVDALIVARLPWTRTEYMTVRDRVGTELVAATIGIVADLTRVLEAAHGVRLALPDDPPKAHEPAIEDIKAQFRRLLPPGFATSTGRTHLGDLARYLTAINRRLERLPRDVDTDRARMQRVHVVQDAYDELVRALPPSRAAAEDVRDIARLVEELRVSLWAQQLRTPRPVSEQRIFRALDAISL
jgi:ATP-dependent helicase HrpA